MRRLRTADDLAHLAARIAVNERRDLEHLRRLRLPMEVPLAANHVHIEWRPLPVPLDVTEGWPPARGRLGDMLII